MVAISRGVDPVLLSELAKPVFYPIALVRIEWPNATILAHSNRGDLTFGGETYTGLGGFGKLSAGPEDAGLVPIELALSLVASYDALHDDLTADAEGSLVQVFYGATTQPGGAILVGTPYPLFTGGVSGDKLLPPIVDELGQQTQTPELQITARAGTHGRVGASIYHSDEDQQSRFPGDTLFERNARASALRSAPPKW